MRPSTVSAYQALFSDSSGDDSGAGGDVSDGPFRQRSQVWSRQAWARRMRHLMRDKARGVIRVLQSAAQ